MKRFLAGLLAFFLGSQAFGQVTGLQTIPPNSVIGRIGGGQFGAPAAIPFSTLVQQLSIGATAHSVAIGTGSTTGTFNSATTGTSGNILIDQGSGNDPQFKPMTGSCTITAGGVTSCSNLGGGTRTVTTATDTIASTDCFKTISINYNAGVEMETLPAAGSAGFTAGCPIWIVNNGTRGVGLAGANWPTLPTNQPILYPGHIILVQDFGLTSWVGAALPGRWQKTGPTFYVDNVNGCANTSTCSGLYADGLQPGVGALKSITQAMNVMYQVVDNLNGSPTINLTAGQTYTECVTVQGQLTGINVGFIIGNGGNANWTCAGVGGNAAFLIGDNAEWEVQNITFSCSIANSFGIFLHQTAVVDLLSGTNFGACSGTGASIGSDHGGFINFDEAGGNVTIGPGNIGTFIQLGQGTLVTGSFTAAFTGTPTIGTFLSIAGSGTNFVMGSFASSGALTAGTVPYNCNGLSEISLNGGTLPGSGAPVNTGSHCYVH